MTSLSLFFAGFSFGLSDNVGKGFLIPFLLPFYSILKMLKSKDKLSIFVALGPH